MIREETAAALRAHAAAADAVGEKLKAANPEDCPSETEAIGYMEALARAVESARDRRQRALLSNAMINAFDPDLYRIGLHAQILRLLPDIFYPDVVALRALRGQKEVPLTLIAAGKHQGLDEGRFNRLCALDLAIDASKRTNQIHANVGIISTFGRGLLEFLADPIDRLLPGERSPSPEAKP